MTNKKLENEALTKTVENLKFQLIKINEHMMDDRFRSAEAKETLEFNNLTFQLCVVQSLMFIITKYL